jgi:hypothetical protein
MLAPGWEAGGWTFAQGGDYLGGIASTAWRSAVYQMVDDYGDSLLWTPSSGSGNNIQTLAGNRLPSKYWDFTQTYVDGLDEKGVYIDALTEALTGTASATTVQLAAARAAGDDLWSWGLTDGLGYSAGLGVWGTNYSVVKFDELTEQIWSVQVEADPGFSGNLHQKFEAAYGDYERWGAGGPPVGYLNLDDPDISPVHKKTFGFRTDSDGYGVVMVGDDYVGNYFTIEQMARTSQGTVKRNIDISSPWSHAYLSEQSEVVGFSEVQESFAMINLPAGADAEAEWWEIF